MRFSAAWTAATVVFMPSVATVSSPLSPTMSGCSSTVLATTSSGDTSTPRSCTTMP